MIIAQITDMHVVATGASAFDRVDVNAALGAALRRIEAHDPQPNIVLATGDLAFDGAAAEYAALAEILATSALPVYVIPGNHDDRDRLRAALPDHDYLPDGPFLHYTIEDYAVRIVALDTLWPGKVGGVLCPARCDWLAERLAEAPERPTVIAMHHPPVDIGIGWLDRERFNGHEALGEILAGHGQVLRVLCGHVHRGVQIPWAGTMVQSAPSTAYAFPLDIGPDATRGWLTEPPGYALHYWRPDTGLISHTGYVGDFGARQDFPAR